MSSCTAIIPYTPPVAPEEFIRKEVEKARANGGILKLSLLPQHTIPKLFESEMDAVTSIFSRFIKSLDGMDFKPMSFREGVGSRAASLESMSFSRFESFDRTMSPLMSYRITNPHRESILHSSEYGDRTMSPSMSYRITNPHRESILHSSEYGDLMKDPDVLFHGVNAAIWKIPSILELGILSKSAASIKGVSLGFNYGSQTRLGVKNGYNEETFISCARSPVHIDALGDKAGAFGLYIKNGISFAVRGVSAIGTYSLREHDSDIPGEAMVDYTIPAESIIGLVVPKSLLSTKITDINFLQGGAIGTFHLRCQNLLGYLEKKIDIEPSLAAAVAIPVGSEEDRARLAILFNGLILKCFSSKIDIESACLVDLLKVLIPSELNIYDTNGFKIA
jgi:hypothetical protein